MKKLMKILALALCLVLALCAPVLAEETLADGLYTIGVSSNARMFKVVDCVLRVEDGRMTAVLTLSGKGYGYVFPGTAEEAAAAPVDTWVPFVEDWEGNYTYAVEIGSLDADTPVAGYSTRYEKWYDRTLVFFSETLAEHSEIAPDGVYSGVIESDIALDGAECLVVSEDGAMTVEIADGEQNISFALASLDKKVPVELDGASGWVRIRTSSLSGYAVGAEDGVYTAQVETDSGLLGFTDCVLTVEGGEMTALLTAKNNNFDYIYPGSAKDALAADASEWIPAVADENGAYTYTVKIDSLDNGIQIATYSARKKMWYDRTMVIDSASLVERGDGE